MKTSNWISLRCAGCGNAIVTERCCGDPEEAVEIVHNFCDLCDEGGGFGEELFYDRNGHLVWP